MTRKIAFFIQDHTNLLDLGACVHVFQESIDMGLDFELEFVSFDKKVKTLVGLPLINLKPYQKLNLKEGDFLFIISTDIHYILSSKYKLTHEFKEWLNKMKDEGIRICAICNGAFLLGKAGLLNYRKCTTHWKRTKELKKMFPLAQVEEDKIFVEDENIITSAGGTSGIDVSLHILSELKDEHFAHKVARELVVYQRRNGSDSQLSVFLDSRNHFNSKIHQAQDYVQSNLHHKISLDLLADKAHMSYRNFCRVFKKETNITANQYINIIRKERILTLIQNKDLSRKQVANMVGLDSERHLSRLLN